MLEDSIEIDLNRILSRYNLHFVWRILCARDEYIGRVKVDLWLVMAILRNKVGQILVNF